MNNTINQEICTQCKLCIQVCPCNILGTDEDGKTQFLQDRVQVCFACGQCMAVCKSGAALVEGLEYGKELMDLEENTVDYSSFMNFLSHRRSYRNFKDKPVPDEILQKIVDAINYAPFGSHPEKMHITVVNSRKVIESSLPHIEKFLKSIPGWVDSRFFSFMIKKKKGKETFNTLKTHLAPIARIGNYNLEYGDRISRGAPALMIFHAEQHAEEHTNNSLIYATMAMLAAQSCGMGSSMIGIIPAAINKVKEVREIFKIPENHDAVMSVIVGYPKIKYRKSVARNRYTLNWVS